MNDQIVTDGVSRITSGVYGGGGYLNNWVDTSNAWRVDNHGAERAAEGIEAAHATDIAVEKNGAANELATEKTAAATQLANSLAFSNTQNLLISGFKDGRYDAAVNAAASALAAATNTAAIQASLAECCCEIKEKITSDGQITRDRIDEINDLQQAVRLQVANAELIANKLPPVV